MWLLISGQNSLSWDGLRRIEPFKAGDDGLSERLERREPNSATVVYIARFMADFRWVNSVEEYACAFMR